MVYDQRTIDLKSDDNPRSLKCPNRAYSGFPYQEPKILALCRYRTFRYLDPWGLVLLEWTLVFPQCFPATLEVPSG